MTFFLAAALTLLSVGAYAAPAALQPRAIDDATFADLAFMEQFAAAAYCPGNNNSTGTKLTCGGINCPLVESADVNTLLEFENSLITDVTGYVAADATNRLVVVAFRGSSSLRNWLANLNFNTERTDICANCPAHDGFWTSWREARRGVMASIKTAANSHPGFKLVVVGHSLGGAIATLAAAQLRVEGYEASLYTYGAPRIGPQSTSTFITAQSGSNFRVTHLNDPVTRLPPRILGYRHIAPELYITSGNGVPVTPQDIVRLDQADSDEGSSGDSAFDIEAHGWYFNAIGGCGDGGFELKME